MRVLTVRERMEEENGGENLKERKRREEIMDERRWDGGKVVSILLRENE